MTIYRCTVFDTPGELTDQLRAEEDCALVVHEGTIVARTDLATAQSEYPGEEVVDLRDGVLLPGLIDTHVHFPQVRIIGGLGMPLLEWLDRCALPEESKVGAPEYARAVAGEFLSGLAQAGTTTALVFGSHFAEAMDIFFTEAEASGLRITSGLVVSDRILREDLLVSPEQALRQGQQLAAKWHGRGKLRYAVTPRFSLSASQAMLESCAELFHTAPAEQAAGEKHWFTSHVNENVDEISEVARLFPGAADYVDTYAQQGLLNSHSVLAHNVHPTASELQVMAETSTAAAHCASSNFALGSGLFPLREHLQAGVKVALGSDVGAGTGFSLFKEGLQAYMGQQLLGAAGYGLGPAALLHLATRSGALALGLDSQVGDLSVGMQFDAVWVKPAASSTFESTLRHARDAEDALAKVFALGTPGDVRNVWVAGQEVLGRQPAMV